MSFEVPGFKPGCFQAGADLSGSQFCFTKVDSTGRLVVATANTDAVIGVNQNKPTLNQPVELECDGITKVVASAAITAGAKVIPTTGGQAAPWSSGVSQGIALEAASAAGQIIAVKLGNF